MYITKREAKELLNDVFRPQFKDIICALQAIEAATALLPQALPQAAPEASPEAENPE